MPRINQRIYTIVLHKIISLICSAHDDAGSSCSRQQGKQALLVMNVLQEVLPRVSLKGQAINTHLEELHYVYVLMY